MRPTGRFIQHQGGYATLTLALIGMLFTSMLVIPFLVYVQASLLSIRSARASLSGDSCESMAVEHSLWRLQYDQAFIDGFEEDPDATYDYTCDDGETATVDVTLQPQPPVVPDYLIEYLHADIVLTVDAGLSGSNNDIDDLKEAAHAIVDAFDLPGTGGRYQMGLTRFGVISQSRITMTISAVDLHSGVDNLTQQRSELGNGTNHVAGIDGGAAQFSTGLGDRSEIPNLMIFISDDNDTTEGNSITDIENAEDASGASIFAVGAHAITTASLNAIANEPDEDHVFYVATYEALLDIIALIVTAVMNEAYAGELYDIQVTGPDGSVTQIRALRTVDGEIVVISVQEI